MAYVLAKFEYYYLLDLEEIGVKALVKALNKADLIVCDEIGPMELSSDKFKEVIRELARTNKPVLGTIHHRLSEKLIDELREAQQLRIFKLTYANREFIPYAIFRELIKFFR